MGKFQKILDYRKHISALVIILGFAFALIFYTLSNNINSQIENLFRLIGGEKKLDSSIVIIHISQDDIERLGGWPLKRSYYALLINKLTEYGVKKIGLEVLLRNNVAYQSIYNDLLKEVLIKSNRVVLSSIVTNKSEFQDDYEQDTLIYSYPKVELRNLQTGHLNYIVKDEIYVPSVIYFNNFAEKAFSLKLAGEYFYDNHDLMKVNFYSSWERFQKYSLIEFFKLSENDTNYSKKFYNKIILIGVSDPAIAKTISTFYDKELPGVGLHAILLDNILTGRLIHYNSSIIISIIFIFLLIIATRFDISQIKLLSIFFGTYIIISLILFNYYLIENNYSLVLLPLILLFVMEIVLNLVKYKIEIAAKSNELDEIKNILLIKEQMLSELAAKKNKDDELLSRIDKLKEEIEQLKKYSNDEVSDYNYNEIKIFEGIVYRSNEMEKVVDLIKKVAPTNATVLILGESGSGKELVARAIHNLSNRRDENFVAVNCAAIPETLLESELFGHVKGAFTNAYTDKKGRFEIADGGTIFLDEIAETTEAFQAKLLRIIQFGDFEKVGSTETKHVDIRIIAATNKNIDHLVKQKKFREDLYYRLNVFRIEIPPLRERREDIEVLSNYFVQKEDASLKISKGVLEALVKNEWKGNVRELESLIKRMVIFTKSEKRNVITLKDLPDEYYNVDKTDFETIILGSLREKKFSHSSINKTAQELGNTSRTVVSENFRGICFKYFVNSNYNLKETVRQIAQTDENKILDKVKAKILIYLENVKKDLLKINSLDFSFIKTELSSKYKNLPVRYHKYLDEIIKHYLNELNMK